MITKHKPGTTIMVEAEYLRPYTFEGRLMPKTHVINVRAYKKEVGSRGIELVVTEEVMHSMGVKQPHE